MVSTPFELQSKIPSTKLTPPFSLFLLSLLSSYVALGPLRRNLGNVADPRQAELVHLNSQLEEVVQTINSWKPTSALPSVVYTCKRKKKKKKKATTHLSH